MGDLLDSEGAAMARTAAYGAAHQAQMYQTRWSSFDTSGVGAGNPLMAMASQFGESGALVASMAQMALAGSPQFAGIMQRLTMPPGTDLAAAARFRQFQMTSGRMGMSGITDVFAKTLGMTSADPGYGLLQAIPMLDPMVGGMFGRIAGMLDENLLTMTGAGAISEAAQFQNTMGLLDPTRAAMLQQSLMGRSRANARGRAFDQVANFGQEGEYRLRNQAFTAGFSNDEMAMATLFAERQGIFDEGRAGALRGDPVAVRRLAKAQLAKARGLTDPNAITDAEADAVGNDLIRNEGSVGGGSLVARGARIIQQGLLQSASMPELLGFMESQGTQLRGNGDLDRLQEVVTSLQALGRAAAMSTEAMTKNAMALQQQYGGTVMFSATALATGQMTDRLFRTDSAAAGGAFSVNTNLSEAFSGEQVQRAAQSQRSQFFARIALAQATGRGGELTAALAQGPEAAMKWIASQGADFERDARRLQQDPNRMSAYMQEYENSEGVGAEKLYRLYSAAQTDEQYKALSRIGFINVGGVKMSGAAFSSKFRRLMASDETADLLAQEATGALGADQRAALDLTVQSTMGMSLSALQQITAGKGSQAAPALAIIEDRAAVRAMNRTAAERQDFQRMQKSVSGLRDLAMVDGGVAKLAGRLLDPNFDVIGAYGLSGKDFTGGLTNLLVDAGLIYGDDVARGIAGTSLSNLDQKQAAAMGATIGKYAKARRAYDDSTGLSEEKRKPLRDAVQAAAGELEQYNIKVDRSALQSEADKTKSSSTEKNTHALDTLTGVIKDFLNGVGGTLGGGGGPLPSADGAATSKDKPKPAVQPVEHKVVLEDRTQNGVKATQTAGSNSASPSTPSASAPRNSLSYLNPFSGAR